MHRWCVVYGSVVCSQGVCGLRWGVVCTGGVLCAQVVCGLYIVLQG